jgi:rhodanese-related sulfurtransferase
MKKLIVIISSLFLLVGCSTSVATVDLSVTEFSTKVAEAGVITLDVRTPDEFMSGFIKGAKNIDFQSGNFESEIAALDKNATYAVYCRSGNRSGKAVEVMHDAGFHNVYNLNGGVIDWSNAGMPLVTN